MSVEDASKGAVAAGLTQRQREYMKFCGIDLSMCENVEMYYTSWI